MANVNVYEYRVYHPGSRSSPICITVEDSSPANESYVKNQNQKSAQQVQYNISTPETEIKILEESSERDPIFEEEQELNNDELQMLLNPEETEDEDDGGEEETDPFGDLNDFNSDQQLDVKVKVEPTINELQVPTPIIIINSCTIRKFPEKKSSNIRSQPTSNINKISVDIVKKAEPRPPRPRPRPQQQQEPPFMCQICFVFLRCKRYLRNHMKTHSELRPFECSDCPATFKNSRALKLHLIAHGRMAGVKCPICNRAFRCRGAMIDHERTHYGERPFQCQQPNCGSTFSSKSALNMHHHIKHSEEMGLEQFVCPTCGFTFGLKSYLTHHIQVAHGQDMLFQCTNEGCSKKYKAEKYLQGHLKKCKPTNLH